MQFWILRVRFQVVEMLFSSMYFKRGSHVFLVYTIKVFFLTVAIERQVKAWVTCALSLSHFLMSCIIKNLTFLIKNF